MNPDVITEYRNAFEHTVMYPGIFALSFIPLMALIVMLLWLIWPLSKKKKKGIS